MKNMPIIRFNPIVGDPSAPMSAPQPIMSFKELEVDKVRYEEWKASLKRKKKR